MQFHPEEATAIYFAARLLLRAADEPNPAVGRAVAKLASVTPAELRALLDHPDTAGGIWLSDGPSVPVCLRFAPAASRVRETRRHPSGRLRPLPDGGVELPPTVTSTVELRLWILEWGSLCEVLNPPELRTDIAAEAARTAAAYAITTFRGFPPGSAAPLAGRAVVRCGVSPPRGRHGGLNGWVADAGRGRARRSKGL